MRAKYLSTPVAGYLTSVAVVTLAFLLGILSSGSSSRRSPNRVKASQTPFMTCVSQWDGQWYLQIATEGYSFDKQRMSSVAFFPLYPMLGAAVSQLVPVDIGMLVISHTCFFASVVLMGIYADLRFDGDRRKRLLAVFSFAVFPTAFFMQAIYSESIFTLIVLLCLIGIRLNWNFWLLAMLAGAATLARPVGVALLPALLLMSLKQVSFNAKLFLRVLIVVILSTWGLACYVVWQAIAFASPFAFAQTQTNWRIMPELPPFDHLFVLVTLEPIWSVYLAGTANWHSVDYTCPYGFASLQAGNPLLFVAAVLMLWGSFRGGWIDRSEAAVAFGLVSVPYVTRGYEMCMASQGRYLMPVIPLYLGIATFLSQRSKTFVTAYFVVSGAFLVIYAFGFSFGFLSI